MRIKITFLGAAQNVTGSCYFLEIDNARILVDCGMYQERNFKNRNWDPFPIKPSSIDSVLLTHAHLDHSGLLPKLVKEGFRGKIICTQATSEILKIMLLDSAKIQEEDAAFKRKRHEKEGRKVLHPEIPLYTSEDAEACFPHLSSVLYNEPVTIGNGTSAAFLDAGHVLGSSMISIKTVQNGETRTLVFSGDIGRWNKPILQDPTLFTEADYIFVESTYGDRLHEELESVDNQLAEAINSTIQSRGNIIIPSFALERAQEVLYYLNKLLLENRIPYILIFLDSPMAVKITDVFDNHPELFDEDVMNMINTGNSPFHFSGLTLVRTIDLSKAINSVSGSIIIIAGSGMCTGGRIKHHLISNISRPECTILFVGYQANGTLGRTIVDGAREVRILGQHYPVRARIAQINGLSAHADKNELIHWLSSLKKPPRQLFAVHGEQEVISHFSDHIEKKFGWSVTVPEYKSEVILS